MGATGLEPATSGVTELPDLATGWSSQASHGRTAAQASNQLVNVLLPM